MKRGFIPLFVIAIIVATSALVAGGAYTFYKVNQLQNENSKITAELEIQKQTREEEESVTSPQMPTTTDTHLEQVPSTSKDVAEKIVDKQPPSNQKVSSAPILDVCLNIAGAQSTVPVGYTSTSQICTLITSPTVESSGIEQSIVIPPENKRNYDLVSSFALVYTDKLVAERNRINITQKTINNAIEDNNYTLWISSSDLIIESLDRMHEINLNNVVPTNAPEADVRLMSEVKNSYSNYIAYEKQHAMASKDFAELILYATYGISDQTWNDSSNGLVRLRKQIGEAWAVYYNSYTELLKLRDSYKS